jgi:gluconolactonase
MSPMRFGDRFLTVAGQNQRFRAARVSKRCGRMKVTAFTFTVAILTVGCSNSTNPASAPAKETSGVGSIVRLDPAFDALVPPDAHIEKLAGGFQFTEGPVWRPQEQHLWFSDVMANVVRQWSPDGKATIAIQHGGADSDGPPGVLLGPNGEIADKDGAVLICQHGNRRIVRVSKDLQITPLVERFEGKRFNSPNDLVYKYDGSLYFTDPPYGLAKQDDDPAKELKFNGVFRLANGKLQAVIRDLTRPNGIAFSPDQKILYIANSDDKRKVWMRYDVGDDGTVSNGRVFFDVTAEKEDGLPDGMKLDSQGNLYCAGPGGVWVFSPDGKHLGTIKPPETPANCNWGDDGKSLYITARTGLYRIKLASTGQRTLYQ